MNILIFSLCLTASFFAPNNDFGFFTPGKLPDAEYKYEAKIDIPNGMLEGKGTIKLVNTCGLPLKVIAVEVPYKSTIEVQKNGTTLEPSFTLPRVVFYKLENTLLPEKELIYEVSFSRSLTEIDSELLEFQNWLPTLWWDGHPSNDRFEVKVNKPEGYVTVVNGLFDENTGYYISEKTNVSGLFLAKGYKTISAESEGVLVYALYNDESKDAAEFCLGVAVEAIQFYKNWLGFYPHQYLYILPGGRSGSGGYPWATGAVRLHTMFKFHRRSRYFWTWITAHEIGHQYWGEHVLDGDDPAWLWLGLGIYADRMFTWSQGYKEHRGYGLMTDYINLRTSGYDTTIDITPEQSEVLPIDYHGNIGHCKGIAFVNALEVTLGRELFQNIFRTALERFKNKRMTWRGFQRLCEEESGQNLEWFFDQWVKSNKYLRYRIIKRTCTQHDDHYKTEVTIRNIGTLNMPIPVQAIFEDGSSKVKYSNRLQTESTIEFISNSPLKIVYLDPEKQLAMLDNDPDILPENLEKEVSRIDLLNVFKPAVESAYKTARKIKDVPTYVWHELGVALYAVEEYSDALQCFRKLTEMENDDHYYTLGKIWTGIIYDCTNDRTRALEAYNAALIDGIELRQRYWQWDLTIDRAWLEERLAKPFVRQ